MINSILEQSVVLVVDDHPDTLRLLMDALEQANITVLVATSGTQALEQVARLVPDLILLDAVMPGMDGFATCRALKNGPAADVPVIFMTGLEDTEHVVDGLEAGGIDYLTKPIVAEEMLARMRVHLSNAREAQGVRTALDVSGRTMLATDAHGNIKWATPQAQRLLTKLAAAGSSSAPSPNKSSSKPSGIVLPLQVGTWITRTTQSTEPRNDLVVTAANNVKIRFRLLSRVSDDEILLAVQTAAPLEIEHTGIAKLQNRCGLTKREAEVLYWLACGKSNRDIAEILGVSYRTADKHLEHVYTKLGVESRSGAIATSLRILGE